MSKFNGPSELKHRPLYKQHSWSPDTLRDEAWLRRKTNSGRTTHGGLTRTFFDYDMDELKACLDLGFGFNSPDIDPKLSNAFPALGFYCAVEKQYSNCLSRSSSSSSIVSDVSVESHHTIFDPGEDAEKVKMKLKQWAQVVACAVRQSSSSKN